jgi:hypothetical protein
LTGVTLSAPRRFVFFTPSGKAKKIFQIISAMSSFFGSVFRPPQRQKAQDTVCGRILSLSPMQDIVFCR